VTTTPTITPADEVAGPPPWAGHQQAEPHLFLDPPPASQSRYRTERRLAVIAGRVLLYGTLAVVFAAGLKTIVQHPTAVTAPAKSGASDSAFPADTAGVVASEFTAAYLTWPPGASAEQWRQTLAPYLAAGAALAGGWDGTGSQTVTTVIPAGTDPVGSDTAVITVAARLASGAWVHLAVPVSAHNGTVAVNGAPALVPGLAGSGHLPEGAAAGAPRAVENDSQAAAEATDTLAKFFAAYGSDDRATLAYLMVPGTPPPAGLAGAAVTLAGIDGVTVAAGPEPVRDGQVTVRWNVPAGGAMTQPYALRLERRDGRWYIAGPPRPLTPSPALFIQQKEHTP
jgi:conjugative transposon protein TcpC